MVAEWLALLFLRPQPDDESTRIRLFGRMLNFVSVGLALGVTTLIGHWLSGTTSWFVAGLLSSLVFILIEGLELAVAEAREADE